MAGKKGKSGRKTKYVEIANQELLAEMFLGKLDKEEVLKKIRSGKYSIKDMFVSKSFAGNEKLMTELFKKVFPDRAPEDARGNVSAPIQVIVFGEKDPLSKQLNANKERKATELGQNKS